MFTNIKHTKSDPFWKEIWYIKQQNPVELEKLYLHICIIQKLNAQKSYNIN